MDVSYFDTAFTDEPVKLTPIDTQFLSQAGLNILQYNLRLWTEPKKHR